MKLSITVSSDAASQLDSVLGGKDMVETAGMTDLQFKSWLKQIIRGLEGAKEKNTKEETDRQIDELLKDLKEDLQG
ncbi:MAG: hypothetical protein NC548_18120 [Lachnospiraceae bacterium]|nr:hypothetical protein [Lachnospiraceae bacterium]